MDLTEAEDIKKRWQNYTEELYKKGNNDPDIHDGVVTHLESDILEYEVKWVYTWQNNHHNKSLPSITFQKYYIIIGHVPHILHFTLVAHLFCNWKFVPLNLPYLYLSPTHPASFWKTPVCSLYL